MLSVRDLSAGYGRDKVVLREVSFAVQPGEMLLIMGHNGAGKTTLLNTLFGIHPSLRGEITLDGAPLGANSTERVRRGLAYSAAGRAIFPSLTVGENLTIAASVVPPDRATLEQRSAGVYELFPVLAERRRQRAGNLSGGQRRMLSIGMALMQGPRYLLLDEPSLGLAPLLVERLYDAIAEVRARLQLAVIAVEQSLNPSLLRADRVAILRMGRIVFEGGSDVLHDSERLWTLL
jgi:branched-chain amino acid transport system ATP-binding protein